MAGAAQGRVSSGQQAQATAIVATDSGVLEKTKIRELLEQVAGQGERLDPEVEEVRRAALRPAARAAARARAHGARAAGRQALQRLTRGGGWRVVSPRC